MSSSGLLQVEIKFEEFLKLARILKSEKKSNEIEY